MCDPPHDPTVDLDLGGKEGVSIAQLHQCGQREREKAIRFHHFCCVRVHKGAACKAQVFELVEACHIVDQTDIVDIQCGTEESHDGALERSKVILVGQA